MSLDIEIKSELDLSDPSEELLKWAKKNIREDPDTRCQTLEEFKDLIYSKGECTPHRVDDAFLLRFLRSRKFSLEAAHKLLVNYCDLREDNPQFVDGIGFELLEKVGELDVISVPPYKDQAGKRILLYKIGKWHPDTFTVDDVLSASLLILELAILEPKAQMMGGICILDFEGITMQHALYMTPALARKVIQIAVSSQPMRLEAMHVINNSWMFETFFNFFKPLLHDKMKERLYFHGNDMESLHQHVDPKCLPDIYGGMQPHYDYKDWLDGFRKNKSILKELNRQGYAVPQP
ncbi:hypothetical protein Zmor_015209 [Zophobas morio]|uniref:CRAL-TRIO domain-containing protein n=2 Tax=Zophobas morio TaxID=2755281 RepID=A0AA38MHM0_9CUCU|nr:hypothetical protein Zmor_015209 [Zophobas morio]